LVVEVVPVPALGTDGREDRPPGSLANTKSTTMVAIPPRTRAHRRTSTPGGGRRRRALPAGRPARDLSSTRVTAPVLPFDSVVHAMPPRVSRRLFLAGAGAAVTLAGCSQAVRRSTATTVSPGAGVPGSGAPTTPAPTSPTGRPATYVPSGSRTGTAVALTFHGSGDLGLTNALLDQAKALRAPITVFAVGNWLAADQAIGHRILADGNELANHTFTHPDLGSLGAGAVAGEISRCADVLTRVQGNNGRWFRPSGLDRPTPLILQQAELAGYATSVGYDVDPLDYQDPGASRVIARVQAGLQPGSIVSLHTGHAGTVQAFEPIVAAVRARGFRPVTVSQLLGPNPA